jgi:hypothetical protein
MYVSTAPVADVRHVVFQNGVLLFMCMRGYGCVVSRCVAAAWIVMARPHAMPSPEACRVL